MFDGSRPLWANSRIFKRRVGVRMFQRRSHQPPDPETSTPPELQAKMNNYVFTDRVPKHRRPYLVNYELTILAVGPCNCRKTNTCKNTSRNPCASSQEGAEEKSLSLLTLKWPPARANVRS